MRFTKPIALVTIAAVAIGSFAACSDDEASPDEALSVFCGDLEAFQTSYEAITSLDSSATVGELRAARDDLASSFEAVQSSAEDLEEPEITALETAYEQLTTSIEDISDDTVISEAISQIEDDLTALGAAWEDAFNDNECNLVTPEATAGSSSPTSEAADSTPTVVAPSETEAAPTADPSAAATAEVTAATTAEATAAGTEAIDPTAEATDEPEETTEPEETSEPIDTPNAEQPQ